MLSGDQTWRWKIPELNDLEVSIGKSCVNGGFYIATFDYRMVYDISQLHQLHMSDVSQLYQSRVTTQLYMTAGSWAFQKGVYKLMTPGSL